MAFPQELDHRNAHTDNGKGSPDDEPSIDVNITTAANEIQDLLFAHTDEFDAMKRHIRKLLERMNPRSLQRLRLALRVRATGLQELFDSILLSDNLKYN